MPDPLTAARPRPGLLADPLSAPTGAAGRGPNRTRRRGRARRVAVRTANVLLLATALVGVGLIALTVLPNVLGHSDAKKQYKIDGDYVVVSADFPRNHLAVPNRTGKAPIFKEGVDAQGFLGIPQDVHQVGVYTGAGALDGRIGDVVISGHVNWVGQGPGYLGDLNKLKAGDVVITRGDGLPKAWRVTKVSMYLKSLGLPQQIFRAKGPRQLTLVTCGGVLDTSAGSYLSNVVVTARPVRTVVKS